MSARKPTFTRRNLPHFRIEGSTYFVTFRLKTGVLSPHERRIVLKHLIDGDGRFYKLFCACVMPDHVHLILRPATGYELSKVMKGIKGVSARKLNRHRGTDGSVWQDESWDRILRDEPEFDEKLLYMFENPVKQGLASDGWDYDGWFFSPMEQSGTADAALDGQTGMSVPPVSGG